MLKNDLEILILMGSDSDWEIMQAACRLLDEFNITYEARVSSAHRTPERTLELVREAEKNGAKAIIAGAGAAAHLAGVVAGHSLLPVIAVPLNATSLQGLDALLATVQMPAGIPVACMAIGKAGAANAALFALQILATANSAIARQLADYRRAMGDGVETKDQRLQEKLNTAT
ncbi:MAG: 5-(carboxyamino)imidazole ribonucleotide mutase [Deltaproteobacteria bacterium]|nr:5-(carboxyamino)imidazole ribonucleotide mutase [Deltaproteobacteria bacterium]